ncbi:MAG: ABC transporter ATP-binding protein [Croceimicrobium sp.]
MLKTVGLEMRYRTETMETLALNKVDLEVEKGEFISIMGPSGCGKSTLLNILGMLDKPSAGAYFFEGEDIAHLKEKQRAEIRKARVGFVFQSFNLIDELSVFENVELPLLYQGIGASKRKEQVQKILERMGIDHRATHYPQQLSGGQQQRVAVARATVSEPAVIFADEPTGNLDSVHGDEVMNLLSELNRAGTTIVMVTHSMHDAAYSQRSIRLFDGKVIGEVENRIEEAQS